MHRLAVIVKSRTMLPAGAVGLAFVAIVFVALMAGPATGKANDGANAQVARLYQLQAAFHRALSIPDPSEPTNVAQRVQEMLGLFEDDGSLTFAGTTYAGKGSCAPGSLTLCDFFTNVSPAFQPGNRLVSLSPSYSTDFEIHGDTAEVYFECHFFDESWVAKGHIAGNAIAKNVDGHWLFSEMVTSPAGVPYP